MIKNKNGFISMALVYTFLVIFLFLMLAILRTYIEKDKMLEAIDTQINNDINKDKEKRSYLLNKMLEDNSVRPHTVFRFTQPANRVLGNGNGLFYINDKSITDENNDGKSSKIYFYRGTVENNYLVFAEKCFRILRTNEDGSIRIVYSGNSNNSTCGDSNKRIAGIGSSIFNSDMMLNVNLIAYSSNGSYFFDESISHSPILDILNEWYIDEIIEKGYSDKVSKNTIFCNSTLENASIEDTDYVFFESSKMVPVFKSSASHGLNNPSVVENNFTLVCSQDNDRYSAYDGTFAHPIGLLSASEVLMAGGYLTDTFDEYQGGTEGIENNLFYLYKMNSYWTFSPYSKKYVLSINGAYTVSVNSSGYMEKKDTTETAEIIPVISLNANVKVKSGDGTINNPYVID